MSPSIINAIAKRIGYAILAFIIAFITSFIIQWLDINGNGETWARIFFVAVFLVQYHELRHHGGLK